MNTSCRASGWSGEQTQEIGAEGYDVDGRTQQGHFSRQLFQNSGQEIQLHVIVAADFQGNIVFVSSRPLSG